MRKISSIMLALTMLVSMFATYQIIGNAAVPEDDPTKYVKYTTEAGSIAIEVENIVIDKENVKIESIKEASGRKHVKFIPVDIVQPAADTPAMAGCEVTFDQGGRYTVWLRYIAVNNGTDSVWMDYGGVKARTKAVGYFDVGPSLHSVSDTDYLWYKAGVITKEAGDTIKLRMRAREPHFIVDKVIITKTMGYEPEGTGKLPDPSEANSIAKMPEDRYPIPTITPPPEHPRVLFKTENIPQIKENIKHPENAKLVQAFNTLKNTEYNGELEDKDPNHEPDKLEVIVAKAFDYAIYGDEENGKNAISAIKNYAMQLQVASAGDNTRQEGQVVKVLGQVYDWCYQLLSDADKAELMMLAQMISTDMEVGFPPDAQGIICGHGAEHQLYRDWLSMAIACYDEYPDAYNMVAGKIFSDDSVTYRNWWYQSGTHPQGSDYGPQMRYKAEVYAHLLIKRMSGVDLFDGIEDVAYEWIYRRRPDGILMIDGDDNSPNAYIKKNTYGTQEKDAMFLASAVNGDPILKREFLYQGGLTPVYGREATQPIDMLILNDPNVDTNTAIATLPLTRYYASPLGEMTARTGWDMGVKSNDVVATMTIGEYNGMNHAHYDSGHFMIYYKGILANDSGWYEMHSSDHQRSYMSQTVAHNTLLIGTPYNKWGNQNQGINGQSVDKDEGTNFYWIDNTWKEYQANGQNRFGEVIGHEFGPDIQYPEYSYIAGDIADAYTSDYDDGVNEALRHMIFLPTGNDKNPAVFVTFDKIDTKVGGYKKSFLLHSEEEPTVNGNVTTIKRTENYYNGKLVNQTLLPKSDNLTIEKIGGAQFDENGKVIAETDKRFMNKDKNWAFMQDLGLATGSNASRTVNVSNSLEAGWGRVEISPKTTNNIDYMLNVMYVGDADDDSPVENATLIETDAFAGTKIFDRVVMFNKNKVRTKDDVVFSVSDDEAVLKINVAGLEAGTWNISVNGTSAGTQIASEDGGIIYFVATAGEYKLTYVSADANKKFENSGAPELEGVTLFYNGNFIYSDVPPTIRDGRTLIPMRALLEAMDAKISWDEASATATAYDGMTEIQITENQTTAYVDGQPVELDVPAMIIDGRFVIPVRFVAENLGATVEWNDSAKRVEITPQKSQKGLGVNNIIKIVASEQSGSEATQGRQIPASYDGAYDTYWGVSSDNHDAWGIYDFGKERKLDKVMLSFMQGNARKYKFDIEVSTDGTTYTPVLIGKETSGIYPTGKLEEFDLGGVSARYVKYKGYGNSVNKWNSLVEIVFTEKK